MASSVVSETTRITSQLEKVPHFLKPTKIDVDYTGYIPILAKSEIRYLISLSKRTLL